MVHSLSLLVLTPVSSQAELAQDFAKGDKIDGAIGVHGSGHGSSLQASVYVKILINVLLRIICRFALSMRAHRLLT
jgi:hypothetical protein